MKKRGGKRGKRKRKKEKEKKKEEKKIKTRENIRIVYKILGFYITIFQKIFKQEI